MAGHPEVGVLQDDHRLASWRAAVAGQVLLELRTLGLEAIALENPGAQAAAAS